MIDHPDLSSDEKSVCEQDFAITRRLPIHPNIVRLESVININEAVTNYEALGASPATEALLLEALHGGELFYHMVEFGRFEVRLARTLFY
jgi:hypothetical protein